MFFSAKWDYARKTYMECWNKFVKEFECDGVPALAKPIFLAVAFRSISPNWNVKLQNYKIKMAANMMNEWNESVSCKGNKAHEQVNEGDN